MGQFTLKILGTQTSNMKLIIASLLACASAIPIELTPEVAEATAAHLAAVAQNEAGEHAALAPKAAYLEDVPEVVAAKAAFKIAFDAAPDATLQAGAPVFTGIQIPAAYLEDTAEVAEDKASFKAAFDTAPADPAYLEDVPEVVAAKASFKAAFDAAPDASLQVAAPVFTGVQIPAAYLDDLAEVAEAKAAFKAAFDAAAAGEHAALAPVNNDVQAPAPVHVVPAPLVAAPVAVAKAAITAPVAVEKAAVEAPKAPVVVSHAFYGGLGYNGLAYNGLAYNGLGYHGLGYGYG